jgi:lipoyl-dependent peroxiredoxin
MALDSTGRAHWEGDLTNGSGTATLESGAAGPMQVTWKARSEEHDGVTSPEELIAAAHAACYSMAFSARLGKAGGTAITLDTEATATFVPGEGITGIVLSVKGSADGVSEEDFVTLANDARENCPVSQALKGNVPITLDVSMV